MNTIIIFGSAVLFVIALHHHFFSKNNISLLSHDKRGRGKKRDEKDFFNTIPS